MPIIIPGRFGRQEIERRLLWSELYAAVLAILGTTGTIIPIGDAQSEASDLTTVTGRGDLQPVFTYSKARNLFDTALSFRGPGSIPVVTVDGVDEEADSPDDAYWSGTADGTAPNEPAMSVGVWVLPTVAASFAALLSRYDATTGSAFYEWMFYLDPSGYPTMRCYDSNIAASIGRQDATVISTTAWSHIVGTKTTGVTTAAIKVYLNGVAVDDTDVTAGAYVAMENTAVLTRLGFDKGTAANENFYNGAMAGGPLGPFFVQRALSADEVLRLYQLGRVALDV